MTENEYQEKKKAEEITLIPASEIPAVPSPNSFDIETYLAVLEALQRPKRHVTSASEFVPRNFPEQIQFYDDEAGDRRVYFYFNGVWSYVTLT